MPAATTSASGYLSAANFNTFNNKADSATTLAGYGITNAYTKTESDANYPSVSGTGATGTWSISIYGNAATASAVAWSGVSNKPTTIAGYSITDAYTKTETNSLLSAKADDATTLAGYGITDAYTKVQADAQFQEPATTLAGYGITDAYTKTQSDAAYPTKAGAGATGTWGINISGSAATAASATAALGVDDLNSTATIKQWVGLQAEYDALGSWDSATFYNITDAETPSIPGGGTTVAWDDVTGKPSTFPPSTHGHAISEVTNLQTTLDGKAATIHAHAIADVTGLQTALDGKAPTTHNHTTAQVTGLDTALAAKAPIADPLFTGNARAPTATVNTNTTAIATTAFVLAQIADDAPTKTGGGASGTWAIGISGNAATATAVNDNGTNPSMKFWYGTESEYTAIVTKDPSTIYFRSA
jgi:phage-related tail fiber protein